MGNKFGFHSGVVNCKNIKIGTSDVNLGSNNLTAQQLSVTSGANTGIFSINPHGFLDINAPNELHIQDTTYLWGNKYLGIYEGSYSDTGKKKFTLLRPGYIYLGKYDWDTLNFDSYYSIYADTTLGLRIRTDLPPFGDYPNKMAINTEKLSINGDVDITGNGTLDGTLKLSNYTTNGFIKTTGSNGTIVVDTNSSGGGGTSTIGCSFDALTGNISSGLSTYLICPYNCIIKSWYLVANTSGNMVIDIWKNTYANFPPVSGNTITGTEKPTLTEQQINRDINLTTWTTTITAGDVLKFYVDSCSGLNNATLMLEVEKN